MKKLQLTPGKLKGKPLTRGDEITEEQVQEALREAPKAFAGYTWKTECKMPQTHLGGSLEDRLQSLEDDGWEIFQVFWEGNAYRIVVRRLKE